MSTIYEIGSSHTVVVGIDASRCRSGGAVAHIVGLLSALDPTRHGVSTVHLWVPQEVASLVGEKAWLVKHTPSELSRSIWRQLWWQYRHLADEARDLGCAVLFSADAATLCRFAPTVVLSQDLLAYEPGVRQRFSGVARLRIEALRVVHDAAFRRAAGTIFLTDYASRLVQDATGPLRNNTVIPHAVETLNSSGADGPLVRRSPDGAAVCIYVSPIWQVKNQWVVVEAVAKLRDEGRDVRLQLVGGKNRVSDRRLSKALEKFDPRREFVAVLGPVAAGEIPALLRAADVFVFASVCENLPVTLLEAMVAGIPITSSNRGPMPEVLGEGGLYFDPDDATSVASAIRAVLDDPNAAVGRAAIAKSNATTETWASIGAQTLEFLKACASRK